MRTAIVGFQSKSAQVDLGQGVTLSTGFSYDTGISRTGGVSLKCIASSGANNSLNWSLSMGPWGRIVVRFTTLPASERIFAGDSLNQNLKITSGGIVKFCAGSTVIATSTTALTDTSKWYVIEFFGNHSSPAPVVGDIVLKVDSETVTLGSAWGSASGGMAGLGADDTVAATFTCYFADIAFDDREWCGDGKVNLALPISDNARHANWTGGAGGTTNLYDAVNNTPNIGTASETNSTQIEHAGSGGGNEDYDANLTTYSTLGVSTTVPTTTTYDTWASATGTASFGDSSTTAYRAGSFTAPGNGDLLSVALRLYKTGAPTDNVLLELWSNSSGVPGAKIGDIASYAASLLTTTAARIAISAASGLTLTSGTRYWIVLKRSGSISGTNYFNTRYQTVASGEDQAFGDTTPSWTANTSQVIPLDVHCGTGDYVIAIVPVQEHGEDVSTSTKSLTHFIKSNPAIASSAPAAYLAGGDAGALGTYPTNWVATRYVIDAPPQPTVGSSPVMTARRTGTESRVASVGFMGLYVEWKTVSGSTPVDMGGGKVRTVTRVKGATMTPLIMMAGKTRTVTRVKGAALTQSLSLGGKTRTVTRVKGATMTQLLNLAGRIRALTRLKGASMDTPITLNLAGIIRSLTRLKGAQLTQTLAMGGRIRQLTRVKGAALTQSQPMGGRIRAVTRVKGGGLTQSLDLRGKVRTVTRVKGATMTQLLNLAGRVRTVTRVKGAALTQSLDLGGKVRAIARVKGAGLTQSQPMGGVVRAIARLPGATMTFGATLVNMAGVIRTITRVKGAELTQSQPMGGKVRTVTRVKGASLTQALNLAGKVRTLTRLKGATMAQTLAIGGRIRQLTRVKGASLTQTMPMGGGTIRGAIARLIGDFVASTTRPPRSRNTNREPGDTALYMRDGWRITLVDKNIQRRRRG